MRVRLLRRIEDLGDELRGLRMIIATKDLEIEGLNRRLSDYEKSALEKEGKEEVKPSIWGK